VGIFPWMIKGLMVEIGPGEGYERPCPYPGFMFVGFVYGAEAEKPGRAVRTGLRCACRIG